MKRILPAWLLLAGCASDGLLGPSTSVHPAGAGRIGDGTLNDHLESIRGDNRLPAVAAILFGPDSVYESGFTGARALGHDERVGPGDQWHVGSLTKSMTSTLAAILIEQGRIEWNSTIGETFPDIPMRQEYAAVTLKDLLNHTSGMITDATSAPSWPILTGSGQSMAEQRSRLAKEYLSMKPGSAVGTFAYSNAGYIVAGAMLEKAMGESWEDLMARLVFSPLGMSSAGFGPPQGPGPIDQPWGHAVVDDGFRAAPPGPAADNPPAIGPAGTVHGNLEDLVKYFRIHLKSAMGGSSGLVSDSSFRILHTPGKGLEYAFGWGIVERAWAGGTAYQHQGSNSFWLSDVWLAPGKGFGILVVTNGSGPRAAKAVDEAAILLITRFNGEVPR